MGSTEGIECDAISATRQEDRLILLSRLAQQWLPESAVLAALMAEVVLQGEVKSEIVVAQAYCLHHQRDQLSLAQPSVVQRQGQSGAPRRSKPVPAFLHSSACS